MTQKYEFEPIESDGQEYMIANPVNQTADPVRLEASWIEDDDIEGEWERAVRAIIKTDLLGSMELKEGNGRIDRRQAIETLAEASDEDGDIVTSQQQAEALIEYFAHEDILELRGGQVVMLRNPADNPDENYRMSLNWAAAIDACVEKITETKDQIDSAKKKLEDRMADVDQDSRKIDENLKETAQELKSLGDGAGVPQDPEQLSADEQDRFKQLKRKLVYHKKMKEANGENLAGKIKDGTNQLADQLEMLESAKTTLINKGEEVRTRAVHKNAFPKEALGIVDSMGKLTTTLAGVGSVDKAVDEMDDNEVGTAVDDILGDIDDLGETAEQAVGDELSDADAETNKLGM